MKECSGKTAALGRHSRNCKVCAHEKCGEIEADLEWKSPTIIAKQFQLRDRMNIYRHAHALGLFEKRRRNLRAVLERIVKRVDEVEVNAARSSPRFKLWRRSIFKASGSNARSKST
jgi:hypothetical protein